MRGNDRDLDSDLESDDEEEVQNEVEKVIPQPQVEEKPAKQSTPNNYEQLFNKPAQQEVKVEQ